jgi:hypothetical protein
MERVVETTCLLYLHAAHEHGWCIEISAQQYSSF